MITVLASIILVNGLHLLDDNIVCIHAHLFIIKRGLDVI